MLNIDLRRIFLLSVLIVGCFPVFSQSYSSLNWFFGNNTNSFRFVRPGFTTEFVDLPFSLGTGGSAVATHPITGNLLFYTDGNTVYDAFDNPLTPNLIGNPALNQGVAICVNPADSLEYFIFTNDGTQIRRSVFDYGEYSGATPGFPAPALGSITATVNDPTNLPSGTLSEGMLIVPNDVLDGFWLISYNEATSEFNITGIDNTGAITTTTQAVAGAPTSISNIAFNKITNQLSVAPANANETVAILSIDRATGALSFVQAIAGTEVVTAGGFIYDTEWNNSGDILYISGLADSLWQINFTDPTPALAGVNRQNQVQSFGLQMGPDSAIYHLYQNAAGRFLVGRINAPDSVIGQTLYEPAPVGINDFAARQFPAFLPLYDLMPNVNFSFAGTCANVPTLFFPQIDPPADSVLWDFGDGNFSNQLSPRNTFTAAGAFNVRMAAFHNGIPTVVTNVVDIVEFDLQISGVPQVDTLCAEDFPATYTATASGGNANSVTFRWSNQDDTNAGPTTTITEAGNYYVVATDPNGCEAYAPIQVVEYRAIEQRAFIWYFGDNAGIDFNPIADDPPGPATAIPFGDPNTFNGGNQIQAPEGCAIFCDDNGNPIFYLDGDEIYDREGNEIATEIGGSEGASQSVLIVPAPGDATLYYIFLNKEVYSASGAFEYQLLYTVFDLKAREGLGDLVRDNNDEVVVSELYNGNTERITGNVNWVIVHELGNNNFRSYPITQFGVGNAVVSNVGSVHDATSENGRAAQGYMKLSNGGNLAVALSLSNTENFVELFNFVDSSGAVTNPVRLDMTPETGQVYGIEFSPDENKLFATLRNANNGGSKAFWWEIDTTTVVGEVTDPSHIRNSFELIADEAGVDFGALQQGPDGQIYMAKDGAPNLGTFGNPNGIPGLTDPQFNLSGFTLAGGTTSTLGLPNFLNQFASAPSGILAGVRNGCSGETLDFSLLNTSPLERYRWRINDSNGNEVIRSGVTDNGNFSFIISTPGTYTAIVDIIPDCSTFEVPVTSVQANFTINPLPTFSVENVTDPSSCDLNDGNFDLNITSSGTFVYSLSGPVAVSPDTVVGPTVFNIPNLGAGGYTVFVTNTQTGCDETEVVVLNDPIAYTVQASTELANCAGEDGIIEVDFVGTPPAGDINYLVRNQLNSSFVTSGTESGVPFTINVNVGTYLVEVTDADGCTSTVADLLIETPPQVDLTLPVEVIVCDDQPAIIIFSSANAVSVNVSGPSQPAFQADNSADPDSVIVSAAGIYNFIAAGDGVTTCDNVNSVEVILNSPSENPFASRYVICPDDPVEENRTLRFPNPPSGFESVRWLESNGNEITSNSGNYEFNAARDTLIVLNDGNITAELTNFFGCVTIAEIGIIEDCQARINAPSAFSPNEDGLNDVFRVFPILVAEEDFEFFIFNRWGELIFQSTDLNAMSAPADGAGWNGGYDNDPSRPVPGGTYAYRVNFRNAAKPNEGVQEQRGGVTLIR